MTDMDIDARRQGTLGHLTLNRPKAINALTAGMVNAIDAALAQWAAEDEVNAVLIDGAGERGLCAGGDIRFLYENARAGTFEAAERFLCDEYRMNAHIARFPKPYIAIMDGLVMGGGVGVSAHGSVRIVTERTRLAMPEVGIGFVPDVGSTYLLSAAAGEYGTHAALTGETIGAADAMLCGLADHHVASDRLPALVEALSECRDAAAIAQCVAAHASPAAPGRLAEAAWIDACYRHDDVGEIMAALADRPEEAAQAAAKRIGGNAPASLVVTLRALRNGRRLGRLEPCLEQEYRLGTGLLRHPDFIEGVRAAVIDKDRNPAWHPAVLADVDPDVIDGLFRSTVSLDFPAA
ncbi:MAG: enoyl-CoA hydratase/isomerase family protein [Janthinobacterium lividum]